MSARRRDAGGYADTYVSPPVELLDIGRDTVVVVRGESWDETNFAALRAAVRPDVLLIHLPPGDSIEVLDEEQMRAAGWVRAEDPLISRAVESEDASP